MGSGRLGPVSHALEPSSKILTDDKGDDPPSLPPAIITFVPSFSLFIFIFPQLN